MKLEERFEALGRTRVPDLRSAVEGREPRELVDRGPGAGRRAGTALLAFAIAAAGLTFAIRAFRGSGERKPATPAATETIAFVSDRLPGDDVEIYSVGTDAPGETLLVTLPSPGHDIAWSPDGTRVAFASEMGSGDGPQIFVANSDGSAIARVTYGLTGADSPSWSPDGDQIVFGGIDGAAGYEIYVVGVDGGDMTRVTDEADNGVDGAYMPSWSRNGDKIAYYANHYDSETQTESQAIYVMNSDGTGVSMLTDGTLIDEEPTWSPDGTRIAFTRKIDGRHDVFVVGADGSGLVNLTHDPALDLEPSWSPDGGRIALVSDRDGDFEIFVVDVDGGETTQLTSNSVDDFAPSWLPAGIETPAVSETSTPQAALLPVDVVVTDQTPVAEFPNAVAVGEGGIWVSAPANDGSGAGDVVRVDPETAEVVARIPLEGLPSWETGGGGMAVGLGSVWVTGDRWLGGGEGSRVLLQRIDPVANEVADVIDLGPGSDADVAVDETGVWVLIFTEKQDELELIQLDPATLVEIRRIPIPGIWSQEVWVAEGSVWVNAREPHPDYDDTVGGNSVYRIEPATGDIVWTLPKGSYVDSTDASDGLVWMWEHSGDLVPYDPATNAPVGPGVAIPSGDEPFVVDPATGVWLFGYDEDADSWAVSRLNVSTGEVDASAELGPDTQDNRWWIVHQQLDPSAGTIWVVHYREMVSRIEIR